MSSSLGKNIAELHGLETPALRGLWQETFGRSTPKWIGRDLLLRALAYRVQEQAEGSLSKATLKRLGTLAKPKGDHARSPKLPAPRPKPGTRLVREWRGELHQVTVHNDGFDYRGAPYTSLSQIAREITGTRWSGPRFFGLRKADVRSERSTDDS